RRWSHLPIRPCTYIWAGSCSVQSLAGDRAFFDLGFEQALQVAEVRLHFATEARRHQRLREADQSRRPHLDTRGEPGSVRARRFDHVPPLRGHRARGYLEGDQPIWLVLRELVAGLHPTPHAHAYARVSGSDTNSALGR